MSNTPVATAYLQNNRDCYPLAGAVTVGKSRENNLTLVCPQGQLSSRHARFECDPRGRWYVEDRGSTNGTFVNGQRIRTMHKLLPGDRVRMGSLEFVFQPAVEDYGGCPPTEQVDETVLRVDLRSVFIILGDLKGSTKMVRAQGPEAFSRYVDTWTTEMMRMVQPFGAELNTRTGDGWLLFADRTTSKLDRARDLIGTLWRWQRQSPVGFRVVVHAGQVAVSSGRPGEEIAASADLHATFRMEKVCKVVGEDFVISDPAAEVLRQRLPMTRIPKPVRLDGFENEHYFWKVGQ